MHGPPYSEACSTSPSIGNCDNYGSVAARGHGHSVEPDFKVKEWQVDWAWPRIVELQRYRSVGEVCYIGGTTCGGGKWTGHILWKMVGLCFSVIPETR